MAKVVNVITPFFFSENEPYMIVLFVEEFENKFRTAMSSNPRYIVVYDVRKIYPDLNTFEAKESFLEEMEIGHREEIYLHEFSISDLTDGKHSSIRGYSFSGYETHFRVGSYYVDNARETAKEILHFCINHKIYKWDD